MGTRGKRWADISSDSDDSRPGPTGLLSIIRANDDSYLGPPLPALDDSKSGMNKRFKTATSVGKEEGYNHAIDEGDEARDTEEEGNENENLKERGGNKKNGRQREKKEKPSPTRKEEKGGELDGVHECGQRAVARSSTTTESTTGSLVEDRKPETNFGSFNATWVPNPSAMEFYSMEIVCAPPLSTMAPPGRSQQQASRKRAKRPTTITTTGRERANMESGHGRTHMDIGNPEDNVDAFGDRRRLESSDNISVIESVASMKPMKKKKKKNSSVSSTDVGDCQDEEVAEMTPEQLEIRLTQREKEIAKWKKLDDYEKYLIIAPKDKRTDTDPVTPVADARMAKRQWKFKNELWHREIRNRLKHEDEFPPLRRNSK